MATHMVVTAQLRPIATPHKKGPPPTHSLPPLPLPVYADTFPPSWAVDIVRFSTISGALTLTVKELQVLQSVPRDGPSDDASANVNARVIRTRSKTSRGQRIDFDFQTGPKHMTGKGIPVYVLATVSEAELLKHMHSALDTVMKPLSRLQRVWIRVQWPFPRDGTLDRITFEEHIKIDASMTRLQLAMLAADVFRRFFEKHRMPLAGLVDYAWLLRPDAFYRVWLVGLERVANDVFAADLTYVKDYPGSI